MKWALLAYVIWAGLTVIAFLVGYARVWRAERRAERRVVREAQAREARAAEMLGQR